MTGHIVAIDLGSSGVKVAVVDDTGNVLAAAAALLPTVFGAGGSAEQDAEGWWTTTGECSRRAIAEAGVAARDVEAVAVTAQYMSIVPIDATGRPVGNTIMWMDKRGRAYRQRGDLDAIMMQLDRHGLPPMGNDDQAHIAVFRALHPELDAKVAAYVEPVDYLNARLTERITANQTTAFPLMVIDNRTYGSTTYSDELIAMSALDPAKLPPLIPYDEIIGHVTPAAADNFGITTDAVVVNGTIDSITSAVGSGALDSSSCSIIVGTTTVIVTHVDDKRADLDHSLISVPSPVPGKYFIMAENGVGGRALDAFLHEIVYADDAFGTGPVPADVFQRAETAAASVTAGSGGVLYFPWLVGSGAPYHDDHMRGGFVNVSLTTTRAHLTRSVLEGVALNAAALLPHVATLAEADYDEVSMGGGGASSDLWATIMADTLGIAVHQLDGARTTNATGAAFLALAQLGRISLDDVPDLLRVHRTHRPDPAACRLPAFAGAVLRLPRTRPPVLRVTQSSSGGHIMSLHPYTGRYEVFTELPEKGIPATTFSPSWPPWPARRTARATPAGSADRSTPATTSTTRSSPRRSASTRTPTCCSATCTRAPPSSRPRSSR